jgi:hypothetical protein
VQAVQVAILLNSTQMTEIEEGAWDSRIKAVGRDLSTISIGNLNMIVLKIWSRGRDLEEEATICQEGEAITLTEVSPQEAEVKDRQTSQLVEESSTVDQIPRISDPITKIPLKILRGPFKDLKQLLRIQISFLKMAALMSRTSYLLQIRKCLYLQLKQEERKVLISSDSTLNQRGFFKFRTKMSLSAVLTQCNI